MLHLFSFDGLFDLAPNYLALALTVVIITVFALSAMIICLVFLLTRHTELELKQRYFSSLILTFITMSCTWLGGLGFAILIAAIAWLAIREFLQLVHIWQIKPFRLICQLAVVSLAIAAWTESVFPIGSVSNNLGLRAMDHQLHPFFILPLLWIIVVLAVPIILQNFKGMSVRESQTIFAIVYFAWFLAHWIFLRNSQAGYGISTFLLLAIVANDVFAYTTGKLFGHFKIVPTISPKKTLEGALGGTIGTFLSTFLFAWLLPEPNLPWLVGYACLVALFAPMGDLVISVIKRDCQAKDSGSLIPGHGGMLDRVGSYILIAPAFYYILQLQGQ